jgi:hypothetical protein
MPKQINFRAPASVKSAFEKALLLQRHIPSASAFFVSCMEDLVRRTEAGERLEWPVEIAVKRRAHKPFP